MRGDHRQLGDAAEQAELDRVGPRVRQQHAQLFIEQGRIGSNHAADIARVLHGQRGDQTQRVDAVGDQRFDVGLQAGAADRIEAGQTEHTGRGKSHVRSL